MTKLINKPEKQEKKRTQIKEIRNEEWEVTTNTTETQRIIRKYYKNHIPTNCKRNGYIPRNTQSPKLNQNNTENFNRLLLMKLSQ